MKLFRRSIGVFLLIALSLTTLAQEDAIDVTGSRIVINLLTSLVNAGEVDVTLNTQVTGTASGFAEFCTGESDMTAANRPISIDEEALCIQNNIDYAEYLVGYNILAIIAHPDTVIDICLTNSDLDSIFAPSADTTYSVYLPADNTATYALLDDQVDGFSLTSTATITASDAETIEAVSSTPGAVGVVNFINVDENADIQVIGLENPELASCHGPGVNTVESRQYTLADRLFVYAVRDQNPLLELLTQQDTTGLVEAAGYSAPSGETYGLNRSIFAGEVDGGRQFSQEIAAFQIPASVFGTISIGGNAAMNTYLQTLNQTFTSRYAGVTFDRNLVGQPAGLRGFCNGEIDMVALTNAIPEEELANCEANNVTPVTFDIANQAVVLVGNNTDDIPECLTTEQIRNVWSATADTRSWADVDASFSDTALSLVASSPDIYADVMLTPNEGPVVPVRTDVAETNADPQYRATAVGNVAGGLTYMSWLDYQDIELPENTGVVSVNGGNGCVEPTESTVLSGEYPLQLHFTLAVSESSLANTQVQSVLWYMFEDSNYGLFASAGLVPVAFAELPDVRQNLQDLYAQALAASVEPEATPEAAPEATPESTPDSE